MEQVSNLTEQQLRESVGITKPGHVKKLMKAIGKLRARRGAAAYTQAS